MTTRFFDYGDKVNFTFKSVSNYVGLRDMEFVDSLPSSTQFHDLAECWYYKRSLEI